MAATIPVWKQALLNKKKEDPKEPQVEDKYSGLPQWKRDLLIKKEEDLRRQQQEAEKPKIIFGRGSSGSSSTVRNLPGGKEGVGGEEGMEWYMCVHVREERRKGIEL